MHYCGIPYKYFRSIVDGLPWEDVVSLFSTVLCRWDLLTISEISSRHAHGRTQIIPCDVWPS